MPTITWADPRSSYRKSPCSTAEGPSPNMLAQRFPIARSRPNAGLGAALAPLAHQALLESHRYRAGHGLPGELSQLAGEPTRLPVLDVDAHRSLPIRVDSLYMGLPCTLTPPCAASSWRVLPRDDMPAGERSTRISRPLPGRPGKKTPSQGQWSRPCSGSRSRPAPVEATPSLVAYLTGGGKQASRSVPGVGSGIGEDPDLPHFGGVPCGASSGCSVRSYHSYRSSRGAQVVPALTPSALRKPSVTCVPHRSHSLRTSVRALIRVWSRPIRGLRRPPPYSAATGSPAQ